MHDAVDKLMKKANPVWQVILGLSRYPVFLTTEHTEHTETNPLTVKSGFRGCGVFRGSLLFGDKSEYVVAAPQYRAAGNTAMGRKNANL